MKTANQLSACLILTGAAALCALAFVWQTGLTHKSSEALQTTQTVTISAKRTTAEEKLAMDKNKLSPTQADAQANAQSNSQSDATLKQVKKPLRKIA